MKEKGWKEIPIGTRIEEPGNAREYKTGDWRTFKPIRDDEKCTNCLFCWIFCPDAAINTKDGKIGKIDYNYCKGCGICAEECPVDAIEMVLDE
jgi:pyruvate ferredoxin oxidoreductase delta subunit